MKRVGLFGGTFNPIHRGHIELARQLAARGGFDEVWLNLSPANPLKNDRPGATDADRREMVRLACEGSDVLRPCFIEFEMERPSYTINTLERLRAERPDCRFSLIVGADNWAMFDRWREPRRILAEFGVTVYPRPGYPAPSAPADGMNYVADVPVYDISSSAIRADIAANLAWLPEPVARYVTEKHLYTQSYER